MLSFKRGSSVKEYASTSTYAFVCLKHSVCWRDKLQHPEGQFWSVVVPRSATI